MSFTIVNIDIAQSIPAITIPAGCTGVALIIREADCPLGFVMHEITGAKLLTPDDVLQLIATKIDVQNCLKSKSYLIEDDLDSNLLHSLNSLTIVICTKDNSQELATCLDRLLAVRNRYPGNSIEIMVVDNAPSNSGTKDLVASLPNIRYVLEPKPGLDFARNRAIQEATTELLAFVDDDVTVDYHWLKGLDRAVAAHPDAAAYTGLVLPAELKTQAQILFERRGGFEKRFESVRFGQTLPGHPFYPCVGGKFGTGCNMAFRRQVLLALGGFDEALDTGATLPGGGDTDMFYRVIRAGYPLVYEPRFLVFHRHRREIHQLRRQYARSWGLGLMAYVVKTYHYDVEQRPNLRRLVMWWFDNEIRELIRSLRGNHVLPSHMLFAELWGGIVGLCGAYSRSRRRAMQIRMRYASPEHITTESLAQR